MAVTTRSAHPSQFAVFYETTQGTPPADAAAWATAENGTDADRLRVTGELNPATLRQAAVVDTRIVADFQDRDKPIKGLKNAENGGIGLMLTGTGAVTADASQVAEDGVTRFMETILGGANRGTSSVVDTTVTSDRVFDVTGSPAYVAGEVVFVEDDSGDGRCVPALVTAFGSGELTVAWEPFTGVATGDIVHGAVTHYIDADALTDPNDANATTVTALIQRGGLCWQAAGGVYTLTGITMSRGEVPIMELEGQFAKVYAPGDGAPSEPTWTGTVAGLPGLVIGKGTKLALIDKDGTTLNCLDAISASFNPGLPRARFEAVTECSENMEGTVGYTCGREMTMLEVTVLIDPDHQDDWDLGTAKRAVLYNYAPAGQCWAIVLPNLFHAESPETAFGDNNGTMTIRLQADKSDLGSADIAKSRFAIARG